MDASIGQMVKALKSQGIYDSTLIVVTAKHGQSPIDPNLFYPLPGHSGTNGTSPVTLLYNMFGISYIPDSERGGTLRQVLKRVEFTACFIDAAAHCVVN